MKTFGLFKLTTALLLSCTVAGAWGFQPIQQPPATTAVPGNVMLALSVEHPTGLQVSYRTTNYNSLLRYDGYFDNRKCYTYRTNNEVFEPTNAITSTGTCTTDEWSGNLLNWLTMTNIDQFRSVMTGGTRDNFSGMNASHAGDTTERTVLIRSFSDRNEYNPIKRIRNTDPIPNALRSTTARYVRSGGYGSKFIVSTSNNFADLNAANQRVACSGTIVPTGGTCFNIRVSACVLSAAQGVTGNTREANCQARYSGVAKPEGLIQEYASNLRFSAFGYLNQTGNDRNGGVLRAAMKSVGPVAATSTAVVDNPNVEWNVTTGVISINPDPVDATASSVGNSGLMNYLNKFGYAAGYKGNDPVSELYYAAQRYMRGLAQPTEYINNLTDAYKDGFPVITGAAHQRGGARDPIIATCQKNFVLGIGDIYTHQDGQLPGRSGAPSGDTLNVNTLLNRVFTLEGTDQWTGGSSGGTAYMAGLAHWANTNDVRPEAAMPGMQTIRTYWVDVLENGNGVDGMPAAGTQRTQYWLAAKYGGFDTTMAPGDNPNVRLNASSPLSWDQNGDGVPDTWFAGSTPSLLKSSLQTAFSNIASEASAGSASSSAVTSSRQTSSSQIINAGYDPRNWSGTVRACLTTQSQSQCSSTPVWEAAEWLKPSSTASYVTAPLTAATRKIFTSVPGSTPFTKTPFQWGDMSTSQRSVLNGSDGQGANRLAYLRGDRALENSIFRRRPTSVLGDVVNAGVTYVTGSGLALTGAAFPGHATYRNSNGSRPPVVYVGGNDGMLHAFSGTDGKELFGYIPGSVFANLPALSAPSFVHRYFVDSTPMVGDFEKTGSTPATPSWGTMLVGGLGAGGMGYYALDISTQSNFATATEATLANLPMWEFTAAQDEDLGYTFNEPSIHPLTGAHRQIAKVADTTATNGVWRVLVGNGFGSAAGKSVLFMIDANAGTATKIEAYVPPVGTPIDSPLRSGLATPTPVDTDRDGLIDTVYAGDALGNMYKFQFSRPAATGPDFVLARSGDPLGSWRVLGRVYASGEPITTAPSISRSCGGAGWNVSFGTGKLNEEGDYPSTASTSFYNVVDSSPSSTLLVDSSAIATIEYYRQDIPDTDLIGRNWSTPELDNRRGWRMVFTDGARVLGNSTMPPDTGTVAFGITQPSGDVCRAENSGFIMAVGVCSGASGNINVNGTLVGGFGLNSTGIVKLSNTYANFENKQTVVCNQAACKPNTETDPACIADPSLPQCQRSPNIAGEKAPRGRYSWREILTK